MIDLDDRIASGMRDQRAVRDERRRSGERQIGWKVGFGSPAATAQLGIDRPLAGFLMESGLLADGAEVPVGSWAAPVLEAEIAIHLASDVAPESSWDEVRECIAGLSVAIELADLDVPPSDVRAILAGNIYHRHVVLGPVDGSLSVGSGLGGRVVVDGAVVAAAEDAEANTGEIVEAVRLTAELLGAVGERLRSGDVVITGSIVPPVPVEVGQSCVVELDVLGSLRLTFVA